MMNFLLNRETLSKYLFIVIAIFIAIASLIVTQYLVSSLSQEERSKMRIWAEATKEAIDAEESVNLNLIVLILESNTTIPTILYDKKTDSYRSVNIDHPDEGSQDFLRAEAAKFEKRHEPIGIQLEDFEQYLYYDDSHTLKQLQMFPYVQLAVITVFIIISILALLSIKKREQDRLWVGLTKETAHQLGTPISSLIAWVEYLEIKGVDPTITQEIKTDIDRLQTITDRFSKIGSKPTLNKSDINDLTLNTIYYLRNRVSKKVTFDILLPDQPIYTQLSEPLYVWVIENVIKNAVDAIQGVGHIILSLNEVNNRIVIDITDTGKGIPKSRFKTIFNPGYTSKARGWGLGLSLAKRIIESYHQGKIYVLRSELNVGTTIRIELNLL